MTRDTFKAKGNPLTANQPEELEPIPFFPIVLGGQVAPLTALATFCRERIEAAEHDGLEITDGDVVDLIADHTDAPLDTIRDALVVAGYASRFPRATHHHQGN